MKDDILLVGSYPPPYGGCSVHVMRLKEALSERFSVEVIDLYGNGSVNDDRSVVRCGRRKPLNAIYAILSLLRRPVRLVHFHVAGMDAFLFAAYPMVGALRRGTRKIVTIHSGSFVNRFQQGPSWRKTVLRNLLRRFDRIVTVNRAQRDFLVHIGIEELRITVIPAFLPPVVRESSRARAALESLAGYDRVVISSGYGQPYYGFQTIAEALELLRSTDQRIGLILCLYNSYEEQYVASLERYFKKDLSGLVLRDLAPEEFAWLLERCDVYVRATDRDGDAVAIREAQFFGKTVIASDCVERPAGVRLFKTNDARSLASALLETVDSVAPIMTDACAGLTAVLDVYDKAFIA